MEGKQVLLMLRNLESYGLLSQGIKLTGHHDLPPYAEQKIIPCTSRKEQLELLEAQEHSKELSLRGCSGIVGHFGFGSGYVWVSWKAPLTMRLQLARGFAMAIGFTPLDS